MGSLQKDDHQITNEVTSNDEIYLQGMLTSSPMALVMILKTACGLELFDLITKASRDSTREDGHLSAAEISSLLPTQNPQAPAMLDRMLRFLAGASFLTCNVVIDEDGSPKRLYKLAPLAQLLVKNEDGVSHAHLADLAWDRVFIDSWCCLKDAILEGGVPFDRAHGMNAFEYPVKDGRFNEVFNKAMFGNTFMTMKRLVEVYHGFQGVNVLVDVGGGLGATVATIVSKYPGIRAINYDLPHVIQNAAPQEGVEHIAGDMFESVPAGDVILMKWILHDWSDDHCLKILKNCFKALPETGKIILVEKIMPEHPDKDLLTSVGFFSDVTMMVINPGGKERTQREWEVLAKSAGFASIKPVCRAFSDWVIEFYK